MMKSRRMQWAWSVARIWESRRAYGVSVGKLKEREYLENPNVDVKIILKWILQKYDEKASTCYKMWGISWVFEQLLASQKVICSMELKIINSFSEQWLRMR